MQVTNAPNLTFISGEGWKEHCRVYQLDVHQEIRYTILKNDLSDHLECGHFPIIHRSNISISFSIQGIHYYLLTHIIQFDYCTMYHIFCF
jgi:hypothetical protein